MDEAVSKRQAANLKRLRGMLDQGEDPRNAVRHLSGRSLTDIAARVGMRRTDLNLMLAPDGDRTYLHYRRALEAELDLPAYSLDGLLPTTTEED